MDLIYADKDRKDIGVMPDCEMDIAYGSDENDFECSVAIEDHCCSAGYIIYEEDTENGGIIDDISPDTGSAIVTYTGRTWHGILESKVIEPDAGQDYFVIDGEANGVLREIIKKIHLDSLYEADTADSGIEINSYQFERYIKGYSGIRKMLADAGAKLRIRYKKGKAILSAVQAIDYSQDEEFDSSQVSFSAVKHYHPTNHLICMGTGELANRKVIHLFTDRNGGLQPYSTADEPVKDSDYILDTSRQVLTGLEEVSDIYDLSNAETTENYVQLTERPVDWRESYLNYFTLDEDGNFVQNKVSEEETYQLLAAKPDDWNINYADYYVKDENGYDAVSSIDTYTLQTSKPITWETLYRTYYTKNEDTYDSVEAETYYFVQKRRPANWRKNYGDYYYHYSDGVTEEYKKVSGITKYKYVKQTMKPTDWNKDFDSYYVYSPVYKYIYKISTKDSNGVWNSKYEKRDTKIKNSVTSKKKTIYVKKEIVGYEYTKVEGLGKNNAIAPVWKPKKYYTKESYTKVPAWKSNYYYTAINVRPPEWKSSTYYTKTTQAPEWAANKYYARRKVIIIPEWKSQTFYEKYTDNFAELVKGGTEKLKEAWSTDTIEIKLTTDDEYDIGDTIGSVDNITGIEVQETITKKIVKISPSTRTVEYGTGE